MPLPPTPLPIVSPIPNYGVYATYNAPMALTTYSSKIIIHKGKIKVKK